VKQAGKRGPVRHAGTNPLIVDAGGGAFVNQSGSGVFSIPAGTRWLVYSNNPDSDTMGGLVPDFKQYGAFYPQTAATGTGRAWRPHPGRFLAMMGRCAAGRVVPRQLRLVC
jgi:hypothetical protein